MDEMIHALTWCIEHNALVLFEDVDNRQHVQVHGLYKGKLCYLGSGQNLVEAVNDSIHNTQEEEGG